MSESPSPSFREIFEAYKGYHFFSEDISILVHAMSVGAHLTRGQKRHFALATLNFIEGLSETPTTRLATARSLEHSDFPDVRKPSFFKFVDEEARAHLKRGSLRLGTPSYYRTIEDDGRADHLEGYSTVFLEGEKKSFTLSATSGFNCAILCGVSSRPPNFRRDKEMREKFGKHLIEIVDPSAFGALICRQLNGMRWQIRDVRYIDAKYMSIETNDLDAFLDVYGTDNLTEAKIHDLNTRYWHAFYEHLLLPSVSSKPKRFSSESERRMMFELPSNIETPFLTLEVQNLAQYVRFHD